jgi:hypothetical protein
MRFYEVGNFGWGRPLSLLAPSTKKPSYITVSIYMLFYLKDKEQSFVDLKKANAVNSIIANHCYLVS